MVKVIKQIKCLEERYAEQIYKKGRKFLLQTKAIKKSIIENKQLRSIIAFKKNIVLIFKGLKDSTLNPGWITLRNKQIYIKYKLI